MKLQYKNFFLYLFFLFLVFVSLIFIFSRNTKETEEENKKTELKEEASSAVQKKEYGSPPEMKISKDKKYKAILLTNKGELTVDLFVKDTPETVNNFVFLSKEGFYNGTIFHRIIKDFMIQGGDPKGDGTGGPGYKFNDEKITLDYKRGVVAMANSGPDTNGSQFFIMHGDYKLPKNYVIFGQVVKGIETVDEIVQVPVTDNGQGEKSKPTEEVKLEKIEIIEE